jgi:hypothetical protein
LVGSIALVVTAIGVLGALFSLRQSYRERLRQFESMYVQRYWSILDRLSMDAMKATETAELTEADNHAIRSYLFLCEDELEMRKNGYICDSTYKLWADGIRSQLRQPLFAKVWAEVESESKGEGSFSFIHLGRLMDNSVEVSDPLRMSWPRRELRGLAGFRGV